ncbi:hypothetical protein [Massilia pseudoviolaceinigra]|uniref:hypothetical protein n=1 Tax=Massilia pseudoviolaceinigra TaxID=3057165 RepID=UPI0027966357|nr:hypothetical protein [Massilia sp. CCM 9206]MDQ1924655.1 hypothetical protein [Massilia sp. CCM 9206]
MTPEDLRSHSIHQVILQMNHFRETNLFQETLTNSPESARHSINEIFSVVHVIESYLASTPPELISLWGLAQLSAQLQQVATYVDNYGHARGLDHLEAAITTVSQHIQPLLWTFTRPSETTTGTVYSQMLSEHHQAAKRNMEDLSRLHAETTQIIETQTGMANELKATTQLMTADALRLRTEATAAVAELQNKYHDEERARKVEHDAAMEARSVDASKLHETSIDDAERFLAVLKNYEADAAKLFSALGHTGVTGNYQIVADRETTQANWLRTGAIIVFALAVTVAIISLFKYIDQVHTTETVLSMLVRVGTAITITLPGWYLARESARHRSTADRARQTEMELASLGPFIELMEKSKKDAIREELIKKYFGNGIQEHTVVAPFNLSDVTSVLEVASKFDIFKKKKDDEDK